MIQYRYNLLGRFPQEDYKKIANKALAAAKGASAVDTGAYRRSWRVRLVGDFLLVSNSLRYAAPVELGSPVHKTHKHKIRNALARIGLSTGTVSLGQGIEADITTRVSPPVNRKQATPSQSGKRKQPSAPILSPQELRSPALLRNRFQLPKIPRPQFLNRAALLAAIAAATAARKEEVEEEP
jgi:hypothetical protein